MNERSEAGSSVSVALCTYNGARFLPELLASLCRQELLPKEIVVCDDCSSDDTVALLETFAMDAPFSVVLYRNTARLGYVKNFQKAMERCNGAVIAFCDQDDIWRPAKVAVLEACFKNPGVIAAVHDAMLIDSLGQSMQRTLWQSIRFHPRYRRKASVFPFRVFLKRNPGYGMTLAVRRDVAGLTPIPFGWAHDTWSVQWASAFGDVSIVKAPLVAYRQHREQEEPLRASTTSRAGFRSDIRAGNASVARRLRELTRRLQDVGIADTSPCWRDASSARAHFARRASLSGQLVHRIRPVTYELMAGRYHRFSNGLLSLMRDLAFEEGR